jgi:acyl-CoA synthetase (AMP-forming)/AMP-acid ligase II
MRNSQAELIAESASGRLAIADGGLSPQMSVTTLVAALVRCTERVDGGEICYILRDGTELRQSYIELLEAASRMLAGIRAKCAVPGDLIILQIPHNPDFITAFWACVLGGFIPVPVSPFPPITGNLSAPELLAGVWGMLGQAWVITGNVTPESADAPPWTKSWLGLASDLVNHAPDHHYHQPDSGDLAVLLLTSGSTGLPKAVMLTHANILSRCAATAKVRSLTAVERTFNWMPLDHVGGLVMFHMRDVYLGCHQVHAYIHWILEDPLRWLESISRHQCNVTWSPNFAFGLINDRADQISGQMWNLHCLQYIMNGGEPIKIRTIRKFLRILAPFGLPSNSMHPGWGMSETSSGVTDCQLSLAGSSEEDRFVSVGTPHPGVQLRIVDERNKVLPEGRIGRLQVAGDPITSGYFDNAEQNRHSFTSDGWFKTGDLAFIHQGALTVTGRVDDVIEIAGVGYHGHELEAAVEELPFVEPSYTVALLVNDDVATPESFPELAIFFHLRPGTLEVEAVSKIRARIAAQFGVNVHHIVPIAKEEVPKTGIGKLKRVALRKWFYARSKN